MQEKIVLISDDINFFEYIVPMLALRKSDEVFRYSFDDVPNIAHLVESSLLIINSENKQEQTLELLNITHNTPAIVFGYNKDEDFVIKAYKSGMFAYFTLSTTKEEFRAKLIPALKFVASDKKNKMYRDILVKNKFISQNNEVFYGSNDLLDMEIEKINKNSAYAVLAAISPDNDSKFKILPRQIETMILNNIRENDILINYAANKYFLLLQDIDMDNAKVLWENISSKFSDSVYAGFAIVGQKNRQQVVNEALNNLYLAINKGFESKAAANIYSGNNFVKDRNEMIKRIEHVVTPVFYHLQQTYNEKLFDMKIEQKNIDGFRCLCIKSNEGIGILKISCPGFSTVNIDISYSTNKKDFYLQPKRINIEPEKLESSFLQDIIEQFITEFKSEVNNGNT